MAVLHTDTQESQSYSVALQQAAASLAPDLNLVSIDVSNKWTNPIILKQAVTKLKETEFTYFLAAVATYHLDDLWDETVAQEIAGTGLHTWFLPVGHGHFTFRTYPRGSPQALAALGVHMVDLQGFAPSPELKRLSEDLKEVGQSPRDKDYLQSKFPVDPGETNIFEPVVQHQNFLQGAFSFGLVTWAYDSAIAVGLAACNASGTNNDGQHTYFDGHDHFQAITRTNFQGSTGNVSFDPITGTRQNSRYIVENVQIDDERSNDTHVAHKVVTTSFFENQNFNSIEGAPSIFSDGTTNLPPDLPTVQLDENYLSTGLRAGCLAMCAVVVISSFIIGGWVLLHSNVRVVRSAQPVFLSTLAIGVAIMGLSIVPLSFDEGSTITMDGCDTACWSFPWLLSVGFSLAFSALWAKTHRVNKLLQNPGFQRMKVSAFDVAKPMFLVLFTNILVLALWTGLSPLQCEREVLVWDRFGRPTESRGFCASEKSLGFLIALGIINLGPLLFAAYEAYVARNISTEYAETTYILKSLVLICLVCFIGIPVIVIAFDNPSAYFFVTSAIIFVVCMSILILVFAPKVLAYYSLQFTSHRNSRNIPQRFSRKGPNSANASSRSSFGMTSENIVREIPSANDNSAEGLAILSHPKVHENLKEENIALRNKNQELRQCLATTGLEVVEEIDVSSKGDILSGGETDPMVRTELRRLQEENTELKNRLLRLQQQQEEISTEYQRKEQAAKMVNY